MLNYTLGTIEASEALIKDLYIDLRAKVNAWSKICLTNLIVWNVKFKNCLQFVPQFFSG